MDPDTDDSGPKPPKDEYYIDLDIYTPKVIDNSEPLVENEVTVGSVTFVNLDNDDKDEFFDNGGPEVDDEVKGGDNELVKIRVTVGRAQTAAAILTATQGAGSIKVWSTKTKRAGTEYTLGTALPVNGPGWQRYGNTSYLDLWVEGIAAHSAQRQTELHAELSLGPQYHDEVSLTVVGVESVTWKGKGNSVNNDDELTSDDPNWAKAGLTSADNVRVFPDARLNPNLTLTQKRDEVDVEVTLTVAPPSPINVYLRAFDVDDPSAWNNAVDDEQKPDDNRGTGYFKDQVLPDQVMPINFGVDELTRSRTFVVSMKAGDNYRTVANGDAEFLNQLANDDTVLNLPWLAQPAIVNPGKQRIVDKHMAIPPESVTAAPISNAEIPDAMHYASPTLTVWRFLTIEQDSLPSLIDGDNGNPPPGAPTDVNLNQFSGYITDVSLPFHDPIFSADKTRPDIADIIDVGVINVVPGVMLDTNDPSPNITEGNNAGRFENGTIHLGEPVPGGSRAAFRTIFGNGPNFLRLPVGTFLGLSATLSSQSGFTMEGTISKIAKDPSDGSYIWTLSVADVDAGTWALFHQGTISIGGPNTPIEIIDVEPGQPNLRKVITSQMKIPFSADDDDNLNLLPFMPNALNPLFTAAYSDAYLEARTISAVNDVLHVPVENYIYAFDDKGIPLLDPLVAESQLIPLRANDYWVGYLIWSHEWQAKFDYDPNMEGLDLDAVASGRGQAWPDNRPAKATVAVEVTRETFYNGIVSAQEWTNFGYGSFMTLLWRTAAHEIGHEFGLGHMPPDGTLMSAASPNMTDVTFESNTHFRPTDLNEIRGRPHSPGT